MEADRKQYISADEITRKLNRWHRLNKDNRLKGNYVRIPPSEVEESFKEDCNKLGNKQGSLISYQELAYQGYDIVENYNI